MLGLLHSFGNSFVNCCNVELLCLQPTIRRQMGWLSASTGVWNRYLGVIVVGSRTNGVPCSHSVSLHSTARFRMLFRVYLFRLCMASNLYYLLMYNWIQFSCLQCTTLWLLGALFRVRLRPPSLMHRSACNEWPIVTGVKSTWRLVSRFG